MQSLHYAPLLRGHPPCDFVEIGTRLNLKHVPNLGGCPVT